MTGTGYVGRFAPSPTGPLHAGSLVAALASWLDARAWNDGRGGRWLLRIEDLDTARNAPGMAVEITRQLHALGLVPDGATVLQSQRIAMYQQALDRLLSDRRAFACGCSRSDIATELARQGRPRTREGELVYPGSCRMGLRGKPARAWRFALRPLDDAADPTTSADLTVAWHDRRLGPQAQDVAAGVGDFVLRRADGPFAYQLAVVVDDAAQGITHVVRGEDLADNTARQLLLQRALGLATPQYLHVPLVRGSDGDKLSKQNGAQALDTTDPLAALNTAAARLGLAGRYGTRAEALAFWVSAWRALYNPQL